jgi:hypothetical protein
VLVSQAVIAAEFFAGIPEHLTAKAAILVAEYV